MKITVPEIVSLKGKRRITCITAYDYVSARLADEVGFDVILVGDSASMVIHGYRDTLRVDMDTMLMHTRVVGRTVEKALVVADMPFLSYQISEEEAIRNAGLFLKAGADAVKLEGSYEVLSTIEKLVSFGIPVMGHIGLNPQKYLSYGGYKLRGKDPEELVQEALALQEAGVFSIVLEKVPSNSAKEVTRSLDIPTIGIGAGPHTDGQVLVFHDVLGLFPDFKPRFVRRYLNGYDLFREALNRFKQDVLSGDFPSEEESYP